ncbi:MAG: ATP-binding protein, partial [Nocardioidaceae bacterium]
TDGLVESRTQDLDVGTAALAAALAREGGAADLEATADALLDAMGRRDGHEDDDVAMVLVRLEPSAAVLAALDVTVARAADLASSREVVAKVVQQGGAGALTEVAEQVATELLANALEHGMPPVRLHVHVTGTRVVIEVSDRGLEKPVHRAAGAEDARGRGLVVTAALASRWGTRMTSSGKTVWADLARP